MNRDSLASRRDFLATAAGFAAASCTPVAAAQPSADRALIAITLDLEMARNFPRREDVHWDYEKGNLNDEAKAYAVEAGRRVRAAGGVIHYFAVGQVFEQEDVRWLERLAADGHPIGNHTYDHVYLLATRPDEVQFRFKRAPWLIEGKTPAEAIRDNVRLGAAAMKSRLGIAPAGFRAPGGFAGGLRDRPDVRRMLLDEGYSWVSTMYPAHKPASPGEPPDDVLADIVRAQPNAQPFVYPDGLIEIPMSPISDIGAFRTGQWPLESFLRAVRLGVEWAIENRAVYDLLSHPSCLYVVDPEFRTIDLVCELVRKAGDRAAIVGLDTLATRAKR